MCCQYILYVGIRFGGNSYCKQLLADDKGKLTPAKQFLAGVGAGTLEAILAVTPLETIKTKLIEMDMKLIPGVRAIVAAEGLGGLYQGVFATILKQGSNQGLRFMFYNTYKDFWTDNGKTKLSPIGLYFILLCLPKYSLAN